MNIQKVYPAACRPNTFFQQMESEFYFWLGGWWIFCLLPLLSTNAHRTLYCIVYCPYIQHCFAVWYIVLFTCNVSCWLPVYLVPIRALRDGDTRRWTVHLFNTRRVRGYTHDTTHQSHLLTYLNTQEDIKSLHPVTHEFNWSRVVHCLVREDYRGKDRDSQQHKEIK